MGILQATSEHLQWVYDNGTNTTEVTARKSFLCPHYISTLGGSFLNMMFFHIFLLVSSKTTMAVAGEKYAKFLLLRDV